MYVLQISFFPNLWLAYLFSFFKKINLFIYLWLFWVFVAVRGLSLVAAGGAWASHCRGFSCCGARGLGTQASVVMARGLSSVACGL